MSFDESTITWEVVIAADDWLSSRILASRRSSLTPDDVTLEVLRNEFISVWPKYSEPFRATGSKTGLASWRPTVWSRCDDQ